MDTNDTAVQPCDFIVRALAWSGEASVTVAVVADALRNGRGMGEVGTGRWSLCVSHGRCGLSYARDVGARDNQRRSGLRYGLGRPISNGGLGGDVPGHPGGVPGRRCAVRPRFA